MAKPKIILLDIEISPNVSYTWGGKYEVNVIEFMREWEILSFAYKELGKRKVHCVARVDFKDYTENSLVKAAWKVLDSADVVIAHFGDSFDIPKLRAKFLEHKLPPPTPFKTIDTVKIARSQFKFTSNKLNDLAKTLQLGQKKETGGINLWFQCMQGNKSAWSRMKAYNKHDVVLLEQVYERLKAWFPAHPNFALLADRPGCPVCASAHVQRRGYYVMKTRKAARFQCGACGAWFSRALSKEEKAKAA